MNKRYLLAVLAVFVVWMGGSYLIHGMLLMDDYGMLASLYRPASEQPTYMPFLIGAHVVLSAAFVMIYTRGLEAKDWLGQGLRFGLLIAFITAVPWYTIYYSIQPLPGMMVVKQIVFDTALTLLLGATVAFLYRDGKTA